MILIEDLGTRPTGNNNHMVRFGVYRCTMCNSITECRSIEITSGRKQFCGNCLITTRNRLVSSIKCGKHRDSFAAIASSIHKNAYEYDEVDYVNNATKVAIRCKSHGIFWQTPRDHKSGRGCPNCAKNGFDTNKSATLYYIKISFNDTIAYKIGITNLTVQKRFNSIDLAKMTVLKIWDFDLGKEAYEKEKEILNTYKEFKYEGPNLLSGRGNTELFTIDVLGLDQESTSLY